MGRTAWRTVRVGIVAVLVALAVPAVALADEESFCGGGDFVEDGSTELYEIEEKLEIGEVQEARDRLVAGMMRGTFSGQARSMALGVWAEAELRLGHFRRATRLYQRAIRAQDASERDPLHVGLAIAELHRGQLRSARARASDFLASACEGENVDDAVACYGARLVLSRSAESADSRAEAAAGAADLRTREARLEGGFAAMQALLPAEPTVTVASSEPATPAAGTSSGAAASASREAPSAAGLAAR